MNLITTGSAAAYDAGFYMGGPVLTAYVEWVVKKCLNDRISRLYFIARDGYITKQIADRLIHKRSLGIQTKYIYGSRRAWRFPSYDGEKNRLRMLLSYSSPATIRNIEDLAKVMGINSVFFDPYLPEGVNKNSRLMIATLSDMVCEWEKNDCFREALKEELRQRAQRATAYLIQEIDLSDDRFAFVELQGFGLTQICLKGLIHQYYQNPIQSFYFTLLGGENLEDNGFHSFLKSGNTLPAIIERCARAPHGQTIDYRKEHSTWIPVLEEDEEMAIFKLGYHDYMQGAERFSDDYLNGDAGENAIKSAAECEDRIRTAVSNASPEIEYLESLPFNNNGRSTDSELLDNAWKDYAFSQHGNRFILYGAGRIGRKVEEALREQGLMIQQWLDKDAERLEKEGLKVTGTIADFACGNYDCIVIAIKDTKASEIIKNSFLSKGASEGDILELSKYYGYFDYHLSVNDYE